MEDDKPTNGQFETESDTSLATKEPDRYTVILHNDHYSTMDFVIKVLVEIFHKPAAEATRIMLDVHRIGRGIVGSYTYDIAVTKVAQVEALAKAYGFPLLATFEKQ